MCEIYFQRPDLLDLPDDIEFIPLNPPNDYFQGKQKRKKGGKQEQKEEDRYSNEYTETIVPDVGEVMVASLYDQSSRLVDSVSKNNTWYSIFFFHFLICIFMYNILFRSIVVD